MAFLESAGIACALRLAEPGHLDRLFPSTAPATLLAVQDDQVFEAETLIREFFRE
jgi:hypothetical protein